MNVQTNILRTPSNIPVVLGGSIFVGAILYLSFLALNSFSSDEQTTSAVVIAKEHREVKKTYTTEMIGGKVKTVPRILPESYILKLKLAGQEVEYEATKELFDTIKVEQVVTAKYRQRRFTRTIQIISVTR